MVALNAPEYSRLTVNPLNNFNGKTGVSRGQVQCYECVR
jgi:hypothetical protein